MEWSGTQATTAHGDVQIIVFSKCRVLYTICWSIPYLINITNPKPMFTYLHHIVSDKALFLAFHSNCLHPQHNKINILILDLSGKSACFHPVFGPAFTPYPLSRWYLQSKEILLNLSMNCWNSAFFAQSSSVIIVVVYEGAVKIYGAAVDALRKKDWGGRKLGLLPKLVEKLVCVPVISSCKIFIPPSMFDVLLCWNWLFLPPNCGTSPITIICTLWVCIELDYHSCNKKVQSCTKVSFPSRSSNVTHLHKNIHIFLWQNSSFLFSPR